MSSYATGFMPSGAAQWTYVCGEAGGDSLMLPTVSKYGLFGHMLYTGLDNDSKGWLDWLLFLLYFLLWFQGVLLPVDFKKLL